MKNRIVEYNVMAQNCTVQYYAICTAVNTVTYTYVPLYYIHTYIHVESTICLMLKQDRIIW